MASSKADFGASSVIAGSSLLRLVGLPLIFVLGPVTMAAGQSPLPLLLEVARDPGPADVPPTARTLALGGAHGVTGRADDAVMNPAGLALGTSSDAVVSGGLFGFGRDELTLTPRRLPPFQSGRAPTPQSAVPALFAAAAFRRPGLAGAAFLDTSSRVSHRFTTARNVLNVSAIPGVIVETSAAGAASLALALTRLGGAVAASTSSGRVSVGGAFHLARLGGAIQAAVDVENFVKYYSPYPPSETRSASREQTGVDFDHWSPGLAVSVAVRVAPPVLVSARWTYAWPFTSTRYAFDTRSSMVPGGETVEWRPPPVLAAAMTATSGRTSLVLEVTRTDYAAVYGPSPAPLQPYSSCQTLDTSRCEGWGFGNYVASASTGLRTGVEHGFQAGRGVMWLRGGFAVAQAYTLARAADDPTILGPHTAPRPVIPTPFTPPRVTPWAWSAGWGLSIGRVEVGAALAAGPRQHRLLVDLRVIR